MRDQSNVPPHQLFSQGWCQSILRGDENRLWVKGISAGWGELQLGRSIENPFLFVGGEKYTDGLSTHADSEILVESVENIERFGAIVGFDQNKVTLSDEPNPVRLIFSIEAKGTELWRSEELNVQSHARIDLPLPPATKQIVLKVRSADGDTHRAHADWANAWIQLASAERITLRLYPGIPFSFVYDGQNSIALLPSWKRQCTSRLGAKEGITEHRVTWTEPKSGLECRLELLEFSNYPALEWVVYFRNSGKSDTAILQNIQALDVKWKVQPKRHENIAAGIYRSRGSTFKISDFEYLSEKLLATENTEMTAGGGRSSQNWLPFINTDLGDKGILTAIGWSGQWACRLDHSPAGLLHIVAGMEKTHLKLHPGEEIRTPRMLQLFWSEDRLASHNLLRRFLLEHHTPHIENKPITGPFTIGHWGGMKTQGHLDRIAVYKRERLPMDYLWIDAGWYGLNSCYSPDEFGGDWSKHTGDWRVNPKVHPNGLNPISQAARAAGMKFLLWVEPERAIRGTIWQQEHPDWFLGQGDQLLLNLGKPEALDGAIELLSSLIKEHEVDLYREDFNINPLDYWRANDAPDRQGITEIKFTDGLYTLWDTLLKRHPGLIIDNCASGGRRIDLETISRSVALWSSDYQCLPDCDPVGGQVHNMGLSYWLPLHGTGTWTSMPTKDSVSTYRVRSTMASTFQFSTFCKDSQAIQEDYPWDWFRKMCADYLRTRPFFVGDYYPLTEPHTCSVQTWAVYQMDRPDLGGGFIMAFRRKDAPWEAGIFKLHALHGEATYEVEDADTGVKSTLSGKTLQEGLRITLSRPESSSLFFYNKIFT